MPCRMCHLAAGRCWTGEVGARAACLGAVQGAFWHRCRECNGESAEIWPLSPLHSLHLWVGAGSRAGGQRARRTRRSGRACRRDRLRHVSNKREDIENPQNGPVADAEVPPIMRFGAVVVLVQCLAILVYVVQLFIDQFTATDHNLESESAAAGYVNIGTAVFLLIIFGFLAYVAVQTLKGRPRATGAIVLIEAILAGVAIYMFRGGVPLLGTATLASAVLALIGIFHPASRDYNEARYAQRKARR